MELPGSRRADHHRAGRQRVRWRLVQEEVPEKVSLISSQSVYQLLNPLLAHLKHEEFWVLYLNQSNRLIEKKCLSKGGITQASVDVRLVLKRALEVGATADFGP